MKQFFSLRRKPKSLTATTRGFCGSIAVVETTVKHWSKTLTLLLVMLLSVNVWGADVTHDFGQNISQLLNNNATISSINIPEQDYSIKEVRVVCRYNKSIDPAVTISVSVGGTSWGTQTVGNNFNGTKTLSGTAKKGAVVISFTNNCGSGSSKGTFYVTNVQLVEGSSAPKEETTIILSEAGSTTEVKDKTYYVGDTYTLPEETDATCGDKVFVGWSSGEIDSPTEPTSNFYEPGAEVTLAANNIFYAVFADASSGGAAISKILSFTYNSHAGWTITTCTDKSSYYIINTNGSIVSPTFDVSNITQITANCRTFGGTSYNKINVTCEGTTLGTITAAGNSLANANISFASPKPSLSGTKSLTFSTTTATTANGPGVASITITYSAAGGTTYSNYTTTCGAVTDPVIKASNVDLTCSATSGEIAYTIDNPTAATLGATITSGEWISNIQVADDKVTFDCEANTTQEARTATIKLSYEGANDKTVTITQAAAPYSTIADLYEKAVEVKTTATPVTVKMTNWQVVAVSGKNAYITDGTDGLTVYTDGHGFVANDQLNGTVECKVQLYNNGVELTELTTSKFGDGGITHNIEVSPIEVASIADLKKSQLGALIKLSNLTYNGSALSDGTNTITPYNKFYSDMSFTKDKKYNVIGVYLDYFQSGSFKYSEIAPRDAADVELIAYTVNFAEMTNGSVTCDAANNKACDGETVTLTITPNNGYRLVANSLVVTDADGDPVTVTSNQFTMPAGDVTVSAEFELVPTHTVTLHIGKGSNQIVNVPEGTKFSNLELPTPEGTEAGDCADTFMGWATSAATEATTEDKIAWVTDATAVAEGSKDFYAVFANKSGDSQTKTLDFESETNTEWTYTDVTRTAATTSNAANSGSYYGSLNKNVNIQFNQKVNVTNFSYYCVRTSKNTNTSIKIQKSADGNTWTDVEKTATTWGNFEQDGKTYKQVSLDFDGETAYYVRLNIVTAANRQVDDISISYGNATYSDYVTSCIIPTYSVTIKSNDNAMGSVTVDPEITEDAYEAGTEFYVEATAEESYRFVNWTISDNNEGASLSEGATAAVNMFTTGAADVTLTANFEAIPLDPITVTLEVGERGTLDCEDCQGNQLTEENAGEGVLVPNVNANEGWAFLGWSTSSTATEPEYDPANLDIFIPSETNKTLYAVYAQLYKVTLKYTDEVLWQETVGGAITLPTDRNCKNETYKDHFAGWSETEFAEETVNPTETPTIYAESITPTDDIILYPVFSVTAETTQWTKKSITQVTEGVYALITTDGHVFNGAISDGHGQITENAFVFDANDIATSVPTGICEITMQPYKNAQGEVLGYKMYNADKGYLYASAASSGKLAWHKSEDADWCVYNSNWEYYKNYSGKYAVLRSYNNSSFRTYSSNNGDVLQFAKKETASVGKYWSKPANDVVNPELDLAAGDYLAPQTVKITDATYQSDYTYYYTTDGNDPDKTSAEYDRDAGIVLNAAAEAQKVQVIGYDKDGYASQIASAEYTIWATYSTLAEMYAGFQNGKPVGLTLTDAYIHKVYTPGGGTTKQLFVQEKNSTLGVVLSGNVDDFDEAIVAAAEGKTISFTVTGEYALGSGRQQISKAKIETCTISDDLATRPDAAPVTTMDASLVETNLLGLIKLENVYAISESGNTITVNTQSDGEGTAYTVYDIFNVVGSIPANDLKCNVTGLFNVREGVYSIMPILTTDFDVVEKQDAQLPTVNPAGGANEGEALPVANEEIITITPAAGFTTSYRINDAAEWTPITTQKVQPKITEENTKLEVKATRPYYNDASATYYYYIDESLTKYPITLPSQQIYVKTETDLASAKAGDKVTITISQKVARYAETSVTVVKTDEESVTTDVTSEGNHKYSFIMPNYPVTVKVNYADAPKVNINYNKGDGTGIEGEMPQEHAYVGDEYTLTKCAFHAAGLTFTGWKAYKTGDKATPVTITDNKIIVPDYNVSVEAQWDMAPWKKEGTWELIEDASDLEVGDYVILASSVNATAIGTYMVPDNKKSYFSPVEVEKSEDSKKITDRKTALVMHVEAGTKENTFAFNIEDNSKYIAAISSADNIIGEVDEKSDDASWSVTNKEAGVSYSIVAQGTYSKNLLKEYTSGTARITCYGSASAGVTELAIYKFYVKTWQVTFDDNVEDEEIAVPKMQRADPTTNKVTISTDVPVREGYTFSKWNSAQGGKGTISAEPGDEIELSRNTTLYAQWTVNQYNVAVEQVDNITIKAKPYGDAEIIEGANANVNFKKSVVLSYSELSNDYVFKSWKVTKADDAEVVVPISVASSTTFDMPAFDVKVSAVVESKETAMMTVTYHANGGKNKTAEGLEEVSEEVKYNTTLTFTAENCPFEKKLCTFIGWNTKADGTGTSYKTQKTITSDIDLYAMWQVSAVEYVIDKDAEAKVSVKEGAAPEGATATFETTYTGTLGQLTDGNKGTLTLTGFAGKQINGVKMEMKTNKSGGAGTIVVKVGDTEICSTSYGESFGGYSQSYIVADLQNFNKAVIHKGDVITITVKSSENSLYINGYTIEYSEKEMEYITVRENLTANGFGTICWSTDVVAYTGATFYEADYKDESVHQMYFNEVPAGEKLNAGQAYLFQATDATIQFMEGTEVSEPVSGNDARGFYGVLENTTVSYTEGEVWHGVYGTKIQPMAAGVTIPANRAYINLSEVPTETKVLAGMAAPRRLAFGTPRSQTTDNEQLLMNADNGVMKVIMNNHMFIFRDGKKFNAIGAPIR